MQIVHYQKLPKSVTGSVVSVGNFDGIHRGHELLIKEVAKRAKEKGLASIIVTFEPHTRDVVLQGGMQPILSSLEEKSTLLEPYGIDYLVWIPFDEAFSRLTPTEFLETVIKERLKAQDLVMGEEHTFGKSSAGNKNFLQSIAGRNHITIFAVSSLAGENSVISSTEIRKRLMDGNVKEAVEMLGHPYLITGKRVAGVQKGTQLGFPTINFSRPPVNKVLMPPGVYAAELEFKGVKQYGALYFGNCPTFMNRDFHLEFHAFEFKGNAPADGETGLLWVHDMVRKDAVFPSQDELIKQMEKDVRTIKNFFVGEGICR